MKYNYSKGVLEYTLNNGISKDQLNKNFSEIIPNVFVYRDQVVRDYEIDDLYFECRTQLFSPGKSIDAFSLILYREEETRAIKNELVEKALKLGQTKFDSLIGGLEDDEDLTGQELIKQILLSLKYSTDQVDEFLNNVDWYLFQDTIDDYWDRI
jgi:hypothetical protein